LIEAGAPDLTDYFGDFRPMDIKTHGFHQARGAGMRRLIAGTALALWALTAPAGPAAAQAAAQAPGKTVAYGVWELVCQTQGCAIAQRSVRAVMIFGFNTSNGILVMQVRLPTDAPQGRPVAIRTHKSGTMLHMRVTSCEKTFCVASAAPDKMDQVIALFSKEDGLTLGYQLAQQMQLEVFSLAGFPRALEELRKSAPKK
jgi:invasion protein IalB